MIIDTTVSFHEKRVCMAQLLHAAVMRKRAKKQRKEKKHELNSVVLDRLSDAAQADAQASFARLIDGIERLSIYLKKARANHHNQTVVVL